VIRERSIPKQSQKLSMNQRPFEREVNSKYFNSPARFKIMALEVF
jgi:hypothetical protein